MTTKPPNDDARDDEHGRGAEHPDLILGGEEEHPLSTWLFESNINDDTAGPV